MASDELPFKRADPLPELPFMVADPEGYTVIVFFLVQPENHYRVLVSHSLPDLPFRLYISYRTKAQLNTMFRLGHTLLLPEITYGIR